MRYYSLVAIARYQAIAFIVVALLCCVGTPALAEVGFGFRGGVLIPDSDAFDDGGYDSDLLAGGVLEFDSNLGLTVETSLEYFSQSGDNRKVTIFPFLLSVKYNFFPRYRTTPFVGAGIGTYFIEEERGRDSTSKTQFGVRVSGGVRLLEDRRMNVVIEAARNFVDFESMNAGSFQFTASIIFDFYPTVVGVQ